jgi:hypothetical protein
MNFHNVKPLNPAQKAWETRRAKAEGRAIVEARKVEAATPPPPPSPVADARHVELWLDRQDVGCGYRRYTVLEVGDRIVRLFSAAKLIAIDVDRREFDCWARPVRHKGATITNIIKRNIVMVDRVNDAAATLVLFDGGEAAVRAMAVLR